MQKRHLVSLIGAATLLAVGATPASAATSTPVAVARAQLPARHARASLHVELGHGTAWLGQAVPITVSARFRDLDGVTLEGAPELKSDAVFTVDLPREPRQATRIVDGEPVLVASWTGTLTPSTAGTLALSGELPVRIRYHEAPAQPSFSSPDPQEDPFSGMLNLDPTDPGSMQRFFQSFQQSFATGLGEPLLGRAHDEATTLKAAAPALVVRALPSAGQPPGFAGTVGRFQLHTSIAADRVRASDPLTLTIAVEGDGDLDRVELSGVAESADFKTYPPSAKTDFAAVGKKSARKVFEQVLIPLHGGSITIPPVELPVFDPIAERYTTLASNPLALSVEGTPTAASLPLLASPADPRQTTVAAARPEGLPPPAPSALVDSPTTIAWRLAPLPLLLLAGWLWRAGLRRDREKSLRRALRRSAKTGSPKAFFDAARRLVLFHFATRWKVPESDVTPGALRAELGPAAEPLVTALSTGDAIRFGRRELEPVELGALCATIETTLKEAPHAATQ